MEWQELNEQLIGLKMETAEIKLSKRLLEKGCKEEFLHLLRKHRCGLVDDMHETQRRVDRIDSLIRRTEKESKQ